VLNSHAAVRSQWVILMCWLAIPAVDLPAASN
jgi:hypothetical protein